MSSPEPAVLHAYLTNGKRRIRARTIRGTVTTEDLQPIGEIGEVLDQTQTAVAGWRKVLDLLDEPIEVVEPDPGVELPTGALEVEIDHVSFSYEPGDPVLTDVTLRIPAGTNVAIVGETGWDPGAGDWAAGVVPVAAGAVAGKPEFWVAEAAGEEEFEPLASPGDMALIAWTSGSTGAPKGAVWKSSDIVQYAERVANATYSVPRGDRSLGGEDILQSPIPLHTAASLIENIYPTVYAGCELIFEGRRFNAAEGLNQNLESQLYGDPKTFPEKVLNECVPKAVKATTTAIATSTIINAYSAKPWPSSFFRPAAYAFRVTIIFVNIVRSFPQIELRVIYEN